MSKKAWIVFVVIVVILLGGLIVLSNQNKVDVSKVNANSILKGTTQSGSIGDHVLGKADSKVILVEYGDYQCPYCGESYPGIKAVATKYAGQIAFVFRNFPLTTLHPNALAAAAAAEAAGLQGKYWEMHDMLYENQNDWSSASGDQRAGIFLGYAKSIGINGDTFTADLAKASINDKITFDQALGKQLGVNATPTLYLDGVKLDDQTASTQSKLDSAVAAALKKAGIALPVSTSN